ncbi:MAG: type II toxin-antitoxin system RelE/ParE family toxin [Solobacterium sp.]|nr:type II toxin-antitoxin system RelE/ParE family toxin [Solobacterium sp.]
MNNYRLSFLPQFSEDLNHAVEYITHVLMNPSAANDLIDSVEAAIYERLNNSPEAFEQYLSKKQRLHPYYRIYVKNYVIYYVVIHTSEGPVMEVRRLLNNRQSKETIL